MSDFKQPPSHNPDLVVGDTVDEVKVEFQPDPMGVQEHTSDFMQPSSHNPGLVIGDSIQEVQSSFSEPTHHQPSLVVGDVTSEVSDVAVQPAGPPWDPSDVPLPPPHVPGGIVGDDLSEVSQPSGLGTPTAPFEATDVPLPSPHVPDQSVDDVDVVLPPPVVRPPPPPEAQQQADAIRHVPRSVEEIMRDLRERDEQLEGWLRRLDESAFYHSVGGPADGPGSRALDPTVTGKVLANFITNVGPTGVPAFVAIQTALHRMNAKYGKIFNPLYVAALIGPSSINKIAMDVDESIHTRTTSIEDDLMREQVHAGGGEFSKIEGDNTFGPSSPYVEGSAMNHGAVVDLALGGISDPQAAAQIQAVSHNVDYPGGLRRRQIDMAKMFDGRTGRLLPRFAAGSTSRKVSTESDPLVASAFNWRDSKGVIPAAMNVDDEIYGFVDEEIDDDLAYVPFMLQDLRPGPDGTVRRIYFRALNIQTGESLAPAWNEEEAFGRVDPVMGYRSTGRTINVSFVVHAFSPEDLRVIYMKRHWLSSLTYPSIADDLTLTSGPVCRLRVGDLYNNSRGGLPGVIKSLDYDDSEQVWELKRGYKVPHGFGVSLTFQVLHEGTPGVNNGHFTSVRASIPERSQSDPSRFEPITTETDDTLFSAISPSRKRRI